MIQQNDGHGPAIATPGVSGVAVAFMVLFILAFIPLLIVRVPPLEDFPQHLARVYILAHLDKSAFLRQYYMPNWAFQPNLAIETILLPVSRAVDIDLAGKLFLALVFLFLSSGTVALHYAVHRRLSFWPLLSFFFLYNRIFLGGMVNYLLTLGLSLWASAAWIYLRDRPSYLRVFVSIPVALVLLLFHLAAFGVYALTVGGYEIYRHWQSERRWYAVSLIDLFAAGTQFFVALAVMVIFSETTGAVSRYQYDFLQKLNAPLNLVYNYALIFDVATFLALAALLIGGLWLGWVSISQQLGLSVILVVLGFLAMPYEMMGSFGADRRLTVAIALLLISATDWNPDMVRWRTAIVAGLCCLFVTRMAIVTDNWLMSDRIYGEYLAAFDQLPQGARLAVVIAHNSTQTTTDPPINYIGQYAVMERDAFVNTTFTLLGQQPLNFTPKFALLAKQFPRTVYQIADLRQLADPVRSAEINPFLCARTTGYNFMLIEQQADFPVTRPPWLRPVGTGTDFGLYRIQSCA